MDQKELPSGIKLEILKCVSIGPKSASEISEELQISLPYALTQLTILEARNFLKINIFRGEKQVGKPKKIYSMTKEHVEIILLGEGFGDKFACNNIDPQMRTYLQFLSIISEENRSNFSEYYWKNHQYLKKITAIGIMKKLPNEAEFIAITTKEHVFELREHITRFRATSGFKIACWVNTQEEFIEGIHKKDDYYLKIMKTAKPMLDTRGVFKRLGEYMQ